MIKLTKGEHDRALFLCNQPTTTDQDKRVLSYAASQWACNESMTSCMWFEYKTALKHSELNYKRGEVQA